jgi:hypothetical protein
MVATVSAGASTDTTSRRPPGPLASALGVAGGIAVAKLERKLLGWADRLNGGEAGDGHSAGAGRSVADVALDGLAEGRGAAARAGVEAVEAGLHGTNPLVAAVKGAWRAGTPVERSLMVTAAVGAVVLLLLSPVLALVFLLSLLVISAVQRTRAPRATGARASG